MNATNSFARFARSISALSISIEFQKSCQEATNKKALIKTQQRYQHDSASAQAESCRMNFDLENELYSDPVAGKAGLAGRPSKKKATESGARLAALRKQAGLSQAALAKAVDIPQRTISFLRTRGRLHSFNSDPQAG
jgi:DNA-binding transcriptional regulator YiaG